MFENREEKDPYPKTCVSSSLYWVIDIWNYTPDNSRFSSLGQPSSHGFGDDKALCKVKFFSPSGEGIVAPVQLSASLCYCEASWVWDSSVHEEVFSGESTSLKRNLKVGSTCFHLFPSLHSTSSKRSPHYHHLFSYATTSRWPNYKM